jgi:hypothetical protein
VEDADEAADEVELGALDVVWVCDGLDMLLDEEALPWFWELPSCPKAGAADFFELETATAAPTMIAMRRTHNSTTTAMKARLGSPQYLFLDTSLGGSPRRNSPVCRGCSDKNPGVGGTSLKAIECSVLAYPEGGALGV